MSENDDRRVQFDFEIDFTNGGGIQGQSFRLDIDGEDISDQELADYIIRDLRLLMVGGTRILNKRIIKERHKRRASAAPPQDAAAEQTEERAVLLCSFCGKSQAEAERFIAGPGVYICNECVELCGEVLAEERAQAQGDGPAEP